MASIRKIIELDESVIECVIYGTGDTVILLPGAGEGASSFEGLAPVLADAGFRAVAINLRGAGESRGPLEGLTFHDFAADVAGVIEALQAAPTHVLGHAGGNRFARCLAADRPDLVRSVILVAAGGLVPPDTEALAALQRHFRQEMTESDYMEAGNTGLISPSSDPDVMRQVKVWPSLITAFLAANEATPLEEWWEAGSAPLLVIQGMDDRIAPTENGHDLRDRLGQRARLVDIPNAGHWLHLEQPEAVAKAIISFLRDC